MNTALLIGINEYQSPNIKKLEGCLNDVDRFDQYLKKMFAEQILIQCLENSEAKRATIIKSFEEHLTQAEEGELALIYFCGHGSRERSPESFISYYGDPYNESMVCYDSRMGGTYDLADKELSSLIANVAKGGAEVVVILDCCHSGSGTRTADDFIVQAYRQSPASDAPRPEASYLISDPSEIPSSKHILLAACTKYQTAAEYIETKRGAFSDAIMNVLDEQPAKISYRDLILSVNLALKKKKIDQTPIIQAYGGFDSFRSFLRNQRANAHIRSYTVYYEDASWKIDLGAIHGMPIDPHRNATFEVYTDQELKEPVGNTELEEVQLVESKLNLLHGLSLNPQQVYSAVPTYLPYESMPVFISDPLSEWDSLPDNMKKEIQARVVFVQDPSVANYGVKEEKDHYEIFHTDTQKPVLSEHIKKEVVLGNANSIERLATYLLHIEQWERVRKLNPPSLKMDKEKNQHKLAFKEKRFNGEEYTHVNPEITIDIDDEKDLYIDYGNRITGTLYEIISTHTIQATRFYLLLYLSRRFSIESLFFDDVYPNIPEVKLIKEEDGNGLTIPEGRNQVVDIFKLIISKNSIFRNIPTQKKIDELFKSGRFRDNFNLPQKDRDNWYTITLNVKSVRIQGYVGEEMLSLAGGKIRILGHKKCKAAVNLINTAYVDNIHKAERILRDSLNKADVPLIDFSERGDLTTIVELHHIQNAETLTKEPLRFQIIHAVAEDEKLVAVTISENYEHILALGESHRIDANNTAFLFSTFPANPHDGRTVPNQSVKLGFIKLNRPNGNFADTVNADPLILPLGELT